MELPKLYYRLKPDDGKRKIIGYTARGKDSYLMLHNGTGPVILHETLHAFFDWCCPNNNLTMAQIEEIVEFWEKSIITELKENGIQI